MIDTLSKISIKKECAGGISGGSYKWHILHLSLEGTKRKDELWILSKLKQNYGRIVV